MQKPITVARQEFINNVQSVINESGLPAFLISDVLKVFLNQLNDLEEKQYHRDYQAWMKYQEENKEEHMDIE